MTQVLFYLCERSPLAQVLPDLLEKSLQRGWKAVVQCVSDARLLALDQLLWTYRDDSFMPHGTARDGDGAQQPVYLTTAAESPNGAEVRFCVEGADPAPWLDQPGYQRIVVIFDGTDQDGLELARQQWKLLKPTSHERTYFQQNDDGRWVKVA